MEVQSIERIERFLNLAASSLVGGASRGLQSPAIDIASFVDVSGVRNRDGHCSDQAGSIRGINGGALARVHKLRSH